MSFTIKNHWVQEASALSTKKKGPGTLKGPYGIVYHFTSGWTTQGDIATLTTSDRQASVQFIASRDGKLYQCMPANARAWHAGPSRYKDLIGCNNYFIGIEICNIGYVQDLHNGYVKDEYGNVINARTGEFQSGTRKTTTPPATWLKAASAVVGKELYYWEPYPAAQLETVEQLTLALCAAYPTIKYGVSHEEIDTRGWKSDPGPAFPLARMRKIIDSRKIDKAEPTGITYFPAATLKRLMVLKDCPAYADPEAREPVPVTFIKGSVVFPAAKTKRLDGTGAMRDMWLIYGDSGEGWVFGGNVKDMDDGASA